jgi:hypothetical protein
MAGPSDTLASSWIPLAICHMGRECRYLDWKVMVRVGLTRCEGRTSVNLLKGLDRVFGRKAGTPAMLGVLTCRHACNVRRL